MLWVKSLHIVAVMGWLSGIFYLPRIFVHYVEGRAAGEDVRRLLVMARRLYMFMTVLALWAIGAGLWLWFGYHDTGRWLMYKLVFVMGLVGYHASCRVLLARAERGGTLPTGRALRWYNEAALLMVVPIVLLAVFKSA